MSSYAVQFGGLWEGVPLALTEEQIRELLTGERDAVLIMQHAQPARAAKAVRGK